MKTVVLVRHADIDPSSGPAPDNLPLNSAGKARAKTLAHVVGTAGLKAIYTSPALRTQQTAAPVVTRLGLQPRISPPTIPAFAQQVLADAVNGIVLVVGHSNTVPQLITALGALFPGQSISGHDDLFVVTVADSGMVGVVRLKYGSPTP